jgi:hypothetical protein
MFWQSAGYAASLRSGEVDMPIELFISPERAGSFFEECRAGRVGRASASSFARAPSGSGGIL